MIKGPVIEGLRALYTLLLGAMTLQTQRREGGRGGGVQHTSTHTHYMKLQYPKIDYIKFYTAAVYLKIDLATYDITQKPVLSRDVLGLHARHTG